MAESVQINKMSYRHEAIIDWMLANPDKPLFECAKALNFSVSWLSIVINSDAFKARLSERRRQFNSELHDKTVSRLFEVAHRASDRVLEALDKEDVDPRFALDAKDRALRALGFGPNKTPIGGDEQKTISGAVKRDVLQNARQKMDALRANNDIPTPEASKV